MDGPGHERAALRLGGSKRVEVLLNPLPRREPNLKFVTHSPGSGRGSLDELFPATHAFGSIFKPESARDGEINTIRRVVGVHIVNATCTTPKGQASAVGLVSEGSLCDTALGRL